MLLMLDWIVLDGSELDEYLGLMECGMLVLQLRGRFGECQQMIV